MKDIVTIDNDYRQWIGEISCRYRQSQIKAAVRVNSAMLEFYWSLGRDLSQKQFLNTYGSGFFNKVSADLQRELPDVKGLSPTNIKYFKYFYELYSPLLGNRKQVVDESLFGLCIACFLLVHSIRIVHSIRSDVSTVLHSHIQSLVCL